MRGPREFPPLARHPNQAILRPSAGHGMPPSPDLRAPERCLVGGEIAVRGAEVALQLDGVAGGERHHRLQPERRRLRDMRAADLAARAADLGRPVQRATSALFGRGAGGQSASKRPDKGNLCAAGSRLEAADLQVAETAQAGGGRIQARVLKRQLALPVSTMSQLWVNRSRSAVVISAFSHFRMKSAESISAPLRAPPPGKA
mgnify:FL=1